MILNLLLILVKTRTKPFLTNIFTLIIPIVSPQSPIVFNLHLVKRFNVPNKDANDISQYETRGEIDRYYKKI